MRVLHDEQRRRPLEASPEQRRQQAARQLAAYLAAQRVGRVILGKFERDDGVQQRRAACHLGIGSKNIDDGLPLRLDGLE